tara:strand:+ start:29505 stop:29615 length:111 start_codon:yes stop_codon:yes gene_type:complete
MAAFEIRLQMVMAYALALNRCLDFEAFKAGASGTVP